MSNTTSKPVAMQLDARGLSCPMPIVRARKALDLMEVGETLEVLATDKGAPSDFQHWCRQTDQKFLGLVEEDGYFRLLIKKVVRETKEKTRTFPHEISNADLAERLTAGDAIVLLDVREEPEYQTGHIPGAIHVPIEEIEHGVAQLSLAAGTEIAIVCRSGRRSDYACQILEKNGYTHLKNVVPGMSEWDGPVHQE